METSNNQKNITIAVIVIVVIALIAGAYAFDHRNQASPTDTATSTTDISTSTQATSTVGTTPVKTTGGLKLPDGYIQLDSHNLTTKSDASSWQTYTNSIYNFSLKYPTGGDVRKFIDGTNQDYGIGLTYETPGSRFAQKYFELTTEVGATTQCDALVDKTNSTKTSAIGKITFIRREYNDGKSHVIEYTSTVNKVCYRGYVRLNNPSTGAPSAPAGDATTASEAQTLEDIMSTFKLNK